MNIRPSHVRVDRLLWRVSAVLLLATSLLAGCLPEADEGVAIVANGKKIFANNCAKCHGTQGEGAFGPTIIGDGVLDKYRKAGTLLETVSLTMPYDSPGTLSAEEYVQVVSFLLAQNSYVAPRDIKLDTIAEIELSTRR